MFVKNDTDYEQVTLFNSMAGLTEREKRFLEKSWAKPFAEYIFPAIDETPFAVLYSNRPSKGNTPVNILVGACILQQITDLSDDEFLNSLMFDIRFQYALHTNDFEEQPLSDRSLGRFRARCLAYETETGTDLLKDTVLSLTDKIAELMKIDHSLKRMDSMMIASNIKRMSRLELIYTCTANLVIKMADLKINLSEYPELSHYTEANDRNVVIYHNRTTSAKDRIENILRDDKVLFQIAGANADILSETSEYLLFIRMLKEQTTTDDNGDYHLKQAKAKTDKNNVEDTDPGKDTDAAMNSGILQNPADPDATYRSKDGKEYIGYVGNITESSTADKKHSIITDYQYDTNNTSDQELGKRALEQMQGAKENTTIVADALFNGKEMETLAKEKNITIINTNLTGREVADIYADFIFNEEGTRVIKCPAGNIPKKCHYNQKNNQCVASFARSQCENCPYFKQCKPQLNSRTSRKTISAKSKLRAEKQKLRKTEEFKELSSYRNGVETVPSFFRRMFRVDTMPVRGKLRTKFFFGCMVAANNVMKFCNFQLTRGYCAQNA